MRMPIVAACCFMLSFVGPAPASADDMSAKIKTFCNDKVRLTENSINLNVKQLVTLAAGQKSAAALDSVSAVEISMMHLNCNLFVGQMITQQQFLDKQTEVLQFALDLESVRTLAGAKAATKTPTDAKKTDAAASTQAKAADNGGTAAKSSGSKDASKKTETTTAAASTQTKAADSGGTAAKSSAGKANQNPGESVIKSIAIDLGITLKSSSAVSQSGHHDLVADGITYLVVTYSPIPVQR